MSVISYKMWSETLSLRSFLNILSGAATIVIVLLFFIAYVFYSIITGLFVLLAYLIKTPLVLFFALIFLRLKNIKLLLALKRASDMVYELSGEEYSGSSADDIFAANEALEKAENYCSGLPRWRINLVKNWCH